MAGSNGNGFPAGPPSRIRSTVRFARDPYGTFADCRARYGDPFTLPLLGSHVVVTGQPDLAREMYAMPPAEVGGLLGHLIPEVLGQRSILVLSGEEHSADRKLMTPMFKPERVGVHSETIAEVVRAELAKREPGTTVLAYDLGREIALGVILRAMFGVADDQLEEFRVSVLRLVEAGKPPLIFYKGLRRRFGGLGPWARFEQRLADLNELFYAQIRRRRESGEGGVDMLGQLIAARYPDGRALTDEELRDQLMSFALAGHETMAVTLAWALYWTLSLDDVRARLEAELAADDGHSYLDAVCRETLRIYPIQPVVMRHLLTPTTFAGYDLPAGVFVGAATTLVHMDPEVFPEPERFDPERFVESTSRPAGRYFPFGGGARRCIGAAFAMQEMRDVLAVLHREYRLTVIDREVPEPARRSTVTGPKGGVPLTYTGPR